MKRPTAVPGIRPAYSVRANRFITAKTPAHEEEYPAEINMIISLIAKEAAKDYLKEQAKTPLEMTP